jgi:superfamily II DNA or RNA helicase
MQLRAYQSDLVAGIRAVWAQDGTPMAVLPTGGGKTVVFSRILRDHAEAGGSGIAIAHRKELVGQMSRALGAEGVDHRIIAPRQTIRSIMRSHHEQLGRCYVDPQAPCAVAGVDSLTEKRVADMQRWFDRVTLKVGDEGHHWLKDNKWGRAWDRMPKAHGLLVTATPIRADGRGLGLHADGLATHIVEGPTMDELIAEGHLCPYKIFAPTTVDLTGVKTTGTGDYSKQGLSVAVEKAQITGDIVSHYLRLARGLRGVTFCVDVAHAEEVAAAYRAAGVPALAVDATTKAADRDAAVRKLASGKILQLCNVDLFGEGFDLPAISCVSFARPTQSYALYAQQFGRALRILDGKMVAIIIDHVGNVVRHQGPPSWPRTWTLDAREKKGAGQSREHAVRVCLNPECAGVYERIHPACPYCGHVPEPASRQEIEHVDGDLTELDLTAFARLLGLSTEIDRSLEDLGASMRGKDARPEWIGRNLKLHRAAQAAQAALRHTIDWWAGIQQASGRSQQQTYRLFYLRYGVDVLSARALATDTADALRARICEDMPSD